MKTFTYDEPLFIHSPVLVKKMSQPEVEFSKKLFIVRIWRMAEMGYAWSSWIGQQMESESTLDWYS